MKCPSKFLLCLIVELGVTGLKSKEETLHIHVNNSDNWGAAVSMTTLPLPPATKSHQLASLPVILGSRVFSIDAQSNLNQR